MQSREASNSGTLPLRLSPPRKLPAQQRFKMANRYGEAALLAVRMETYGKALSPLDRWNEAVKKLYPTSLTAQRKNAPRSAFLSLCEAGLVKGINPGQYAPSNKNKAYAPRAV